MLVDIDPKLARLWALAEPIALEAGLELVDIEHQGERHGATVRLLLDKPGGVTVDELATVSRQVSDMLDVQEGVVPGVFTLEVSSPGINRPLTRVAHFEAYVGKRVHVRTRTPVAERHSFRGTLTALDASSITVTLDDQSVHVVPFAAIARAHYQHDFSSPARPRGGRRRAALARAR